MFKHTKKIAGAIFAVLCLTILTAVSAIAGAPMAKTPAPGYFRIMLGDFEVTALSDGTVDIPVSQLLKEAPAKTDQALAKSFLKSPLETSVNAFLINTGNKLVLIDTGSGPLLGPTLGKLLTNLKASGYQPEQVDDVYITHLHPDHIGGLVVDGKLIFPNATVHANKRDVDFWLSQGNLDKAPADTKSYFQGAMASLNPYIAAKKLLTFDGNDELMPGVNSYASPGHTVGHTTYIIQSNGQKLIIIGDLIHVAVVQFGHPGVSIGFDSDTQAAASSRNKAFSAAAGDGALIGAAHLQFPGLGHIRRSGKAYEWIPVNYTQMH
jgi:glyoxylase-like metal-dependent hydrolase (beta-lactamase superfamily II)